MPFLIPIALIGGTGVFSYTLADRIGENSSKILKIAAGSLACYFIYKQTVGK